MPNKERNYTMFKELVEAEYPDLYAAANALDVPFDTLQPLYQLAPQEAVKSLRSLINARRREIDKTDHVTAFVRENKEQIDQLATLADDLLDKVQAYNDEHGTLLKADFDRLVNFEDSTDIIVVSRAKKGSRPQRIPRDLKVFYTRAKSAGYNVDRLRLSPSETEGYVYGKLLEDGTIVSGKEKHLTANDWVQWVWQSAVERGKRNNAIGNPHKAISIPNNKGDYVTLDKAYQLVMAVHNTS